MTQFSWSGALMEMEKRDMPDAEFSWHWNEVTYRSQLLISPLVAVPEERFHISRSTSSTEGEIHPLHSHGPGKWACAVRPACEMELIGTTCARSLCPRVPHMDCISLLTLWVTLPVLITASQGRVSCILFSFSVCFHLPLSLPSQRMHYRKLMVWKTPIEVQHFSKEAVTLGHS